MAWMKETRGLVSETSPGVLTGLFWYAIVAAFVCTVGVGIWWFVAPAQVAIENKTFHQSQAYTDGMARDLFDLKQQYDSASTEGRDAIRATVRERFAGFNPSTLPPGLRAFLTEMGL